MLLLWCLNKNKATQFVTKKRKIHVFAKILLRACCVTRPAAAAAAAGIAFLFRVAFVLCIGRPTKHGNGNAWAGLWLDMDGKRLEKYYE